MKTETQTERLQPGSKYTQLIYQWHLAYKINRDTMVLKQYLLKSQNPTIRFALIHDN